MWNYKNYKNYFTKPTKKIETIKHPALKKYYIILCEDNKSLLQKRRKKMKKSHVQCVESETWPTLALPFDDAQLCWPTESGKIRKICKEEQKSKKSKLKNVAWVMSYFRQWTECILCLDHAIHFFILFYFIACRQ